MRDASTRTHSGVTGRGGLESAASHALGFLRLVAPVSGQERSWLFVIATTALMWPHDVLGPPVGLDPSWQIGLHRAAADGLIFGSDILATYGPLGFLSIPHLYYPLPWLLSFFYMVVTSALLSWSALRLSSIRLSGVIRYVAPAAGIALARLDIAHVLTLVVSVLILERGPKERFIAGFAAIAGVFAAMQFLVKLNTGIVVLVMLVFALLGLPRCRPRHLAGFGAGFVVGALPFAVSGRFEGVVGFFRGSFELVSEYSRTMAYEQPRRRWELAACVVVVGSLFLVSRTASSEWDRRRRAALLLIVAAFSFGLYKHGFVRHDNHAVFFFFLMAAAAIMLATVGRRTARLAMAIIVVLALTESDFTRVPIVLDPAASLRNFAGHVRLVASPGRREGLLDHARGAARPQLGIPGRLIRQIGKESVHIDPWETSAAWAYPDLEWKPLPVFQAYAAYTPWLDGLNADVVGSPTGPKQILRQTPRAIDGRNPAFESPAATLEMICGFREVARGGEWQLLRRRSNRCGARRNAGSWEFDLGDSVEVPSPSNPQNLLIAKVRFSSGLTERFITLLYRAPMTFITLNGEDRFRLITPTAEAGLLMHVPASLNYAQPWKIQATSALSFDREGWPSGGRVMVEFVEVDVNPSPRAGIGGLTVG